MSTIHVETRQYTDYHDMTKCDGGLGRMSSRTTMNANPQGPEHTLHLTGTRFRFGLGYSEAFTWHNHNGARVFTEVPVGYTFGLSTCISANPAMSTSAEIARNEAAGMEHEVCDGDIIVTDNQFAFKVRLVRREFLELHYLGPWHVVRADLTRQGETADAIRDGRFPKGA